MHACYHLISFVSILVGVGMYTGFFISTVYDDFLALCLFDCTLFYVSLSKLV